MARKRYPFQNPTKIWNASTANNITIGYTGCVFLKKMRLLKTSELNPREDNNEDSKRDTHGSNLYGK